MLVNIHHDSRKEHARLLVAGVAFLMAMAVLVGLSIAIYQKAFVASTTVTIKADRAGQQLAAGEEAEHTKGEACPLRPAPRSLARFLPALPARPSAGRSCIHDSVSL